MLNKLILILPFIAAMVFSTTSAASGYTVPVTVDSNCSFSGRGESCYKKTMLIHLNNTFGQSVVTTERVIAPEITVTMYHVFGAGVPFKINGPVVGFDMVDVIDVFSFAKVLMKSLTHQPVNGECFYFRFFGESNVFIPIAFVDRFFQDSFWNGSIPKSTPNLSFKVFNSTEGTDFIKSLICFNWFPNFHDVSFSLKIDGKFKDVNSFLINREVLI